MRSSSTLSNASPKRWTLCGPSATNKRLSRIDFTSSRSMLLFLGLVDDGVLRGFFHPGCGLDHDRPRHFFLVNSDRSDFDQLQHCEECHHDFHPASDVVEKRVEQNIAQAAQAVEQQSHF